MLKSYSRFAGFGNNAVNPPRSASNVAAQSEDNDFSPDEEPDSVHGLGLYAGRGDVELWGQS